MGTVKEEMKPKSEKGKSLLGKVMSRRKRSTPEDKAETFADHLAKTESKINELVIQKEAELNAESGRRDYNERQLARLKSMRWHIEEVVELAAQYGEDE